MRKLKWKQNTVQFNCRFVNLVLMKERSRENIPKQREAKYNKLNS